MEDGALVLHSNAPKFWKEKFGLEKLIWQANCLDLNSLTPKIKCP